MPRDNDSIWSDSEIIPISAISHHLYCPRQNALIHVEGVFSDNDLTTSGNIGHEFVDDEKSYNDHGIKKETSYRVFSEKYGISGIADIVEFPENSSPFPIDYKNGRISSWENQEAQLCAVALCLEEMLNQSVAKGAIYHIQSKKRHEVNFNYALREKTIQAIKEIREIFIKQILPTPVYSKLCNKCSLKEICLPKLTTSVKNENLFKAVELDG